MKIVNSNISFKSNIKIVSPAKYKMLTEKMAQNSSCEYIYEWRFLKHKLLNLSKTNPYRLNANQVVTEGIRSCTGCFVVDKKSKNLPLAFHLYDELNSVEKVEDLDKFIKGTNAFLIGARGKFKDSLPLFNKCENMLKKNKIPTTIMKDFRGKWEADIAYDSTNDDIIICIKDIFDPRKYVNNFPELKNSFNKFELSPTDTMEFL